MIESLTNGIISITADTLGTQLTSLKKGTINYLWGGNPAIWKGQSPLLFPVIGMVKDGKYPFEGKTYSMDKHGFARRKEFAVVYKDENKMTFRLTHDEETVKIYPFKFQLDITYRLDDNKLTVKHDVINRGDSDMYFSIGDHPGFNCPLEEGLSFEDYSIEFEKEETAKLYSLDERELLRDKGEPYFNNEKIIRLKHELFVPDAMIFKNLESNYLIIKSDKSDKEIKVNFKGYPYLGIWTKVTDDIKAPFICIEPWYGVDDTVKGYDDYKNKEGIVKLEKQKTFFCTYSIEI